MLGAMLAHVIEIWVFGVGYCYLTEFDQLGSLVGDFAHTLGDCGCDSFVTYTTLGFGDLIPKGPIRFLTGMAALTGFLLITGLFYVYSNATGLANEFFNIMLFSC